jgi:metal-dependent amidase/aminoacylase/carboxypeptidase family protein
VAVEDYVVAVRLKPGMAAEAERELAAGPPFDPATVGLASHAAYVSDDKIYLRFQGQAAHSTAVQLARKHLVEVSRWQTIVSGLPTRVAEVPPNARCLYHWQASDR